MPPLDAQITIVGDRVTVTRICQWCSQPAVVEVGLQAFEDWQAGKHAQYVWPSMSIGQREMLISGTHPECWDLMWAS